MMDNIKKYTDKQNKTLKLSSSITGIFLIFNGIWTICLNLSSMSDEKSLYIIGGSLICQIITGFIYIIFYFINFSKCGIFKSRFTVVTILIMLMCILLSFILIPYAKDIIIGTVTATTNQYTIYGQSSKNNKTGIGFFDTNNKKIKIRISNELATYLDKNNPIDDENPFSEYGYSYMNHKKELKITYYENTSITNNIEIVDVIK